MYDHSEFARNASAMTLQDGERIADMGAMRAYRLGRVQQQIAKNDCAAAVLMGPINIRYATGLGRGDIFRMHFPTRSAVVPHTGKVTIFNSTGAAPAWVPETVEEFLPDGMFTYFPTGERSQAVARVWAQGVAAIIRDAGAGNRIALDICDPLAFKSLEAEGLEIIPGEPLMDQATAVKSEDELACMLHSVTVAETGMARMRKALEPGMTENALLAVLQHTNFEYGGEWLEYRSLFSGGHSNPWGGAAGDKIIRAGEIVAFDCGLIGPYGYSADVSRTFLCKPGKPADQQKRLYSLAYETIQRNLELVKAGATFKELSLGSWMPPQEFTKHRYLMSMHGIGMCDEWPSIPWPVDWEKDGYDGVLEENMTICVEAFVGSEHGGEGVKLEEQVVVTSDGYQLMSTFPFEDEFLA